MVLWVDFSVTSKGGFAGRGRVAVGRGRGKRRRTSSWRPHTNRFLHQQSECNRKHSHSGLYFSAWTETSELLWVVMLGFFMLRKRMIVAELRICCALALGYGISNLNSGAGTWVWETRSGCRSRDTGGERGDFRICAVGELLDWL